MAPTLRPVNRRALRKYGEFWRALQMVGNAVAAAEALAAKATDNRGPGKGRGSWSAATPEEIRSAAKKVTSSLHVISTSAKKWEAELISREWRK